MQFNKQEKQAYKIFKSLFLLSGLFFLLLSINIFTINDDFNMHKVIIGSIGIFGIFTYLISIIIIPVVIKRKIRNNRNYSLNLNPYLLKSILIISTLIVLLIVLILLLIYMPSISFEFISSLLVIFVITVTHIVLLIRYKSVYYKYVFKFKKANQRKDFKEE